MIVFNQSYNLNTMARTREEAALYARNYRKENKEIVAKALREYKKRNKQKISAYNSKYYQQQKLKRQEEDEWNFILGNTSIKPKHMD